MHLRTWCMYIYDNTAYLPMTYILYYNINIIISYSRRKMNYYYKLFAFVNTIRHEVFDSNYFSYTIGKTIFIRQLAVQTNNADDYYVVEV